MTAPLCQGDRRRAGTASCRKATAVILAAIAAAASLPTDPVKAQAPGPSAPQARSAPTPGTAPSAGQPAPSRPATPLPGTGSATQPPVLFKADDVTYDEKRDLVIARGNVEITQGERLLQADQVTYQRSTGRTTASGKVRVVEPTGDTLFADAVELVDQLKEGVITNLGVRLADNSRMVASRGTRTGGNRSELERAAYSPCDTCKEDPNRAPLWQLKARKVVHDQTTQDITYYDAFLEMFGIPVFYTPYFSHPDPTVERRSGFLAPRFGSSSEFSAFFSIPYYYVFSEDFDVTVEPIFMTGAGVIGSGELRKRFGSAEIILKGSAGILDRDNDDGTTSEGVFRGHVDAKARVAIDENWRASVAIKQVSDPTYLRRFNFGNDQVAESTVLAERFMRTSYLAAEGAYFQGLRSTDKRRDTPRIAPEIRYNYQGDPDRIGGRIATDASVLSLTREDGISQHRVSADASWSRPMYVLGGNVITASVGLRGDAYYTENNPAGGSNDSSGTHGRVLPYASLDWRLPLVRDGVRTQQFIEPVLALHASPSGNDGDLVANEDSRFTELHDTNVLRQRRTSGLDLVEGGIRAAYGLRLGYTGQHSNGQLFLGQSYRFDQEGPFNRGSGLDNRLSDVVTRLDFTLGSWLDVAYQGRFAGRNLAAQRHTATASVGGRPLTVAATYAFAADTGATETSQDRELISLSAHSQFAENWAASAGWQRDISDGRTLNYSLGLQYLDECFQISTIFQQSFFEDREIRPDTSIFVQLTFKNLGQVQSGF